MRLLIITQKIDSRDPTLGFFCGWVKGLSWKFETISVICLEEGQHDLPKNISVYSLGKEQGANKVEYIIHFWQYLYTISDQYDAVFVHMNQEYVLLAGLHWRIAGKPVFFWRNHPRGDILTRIAVCLSTKVFCTSRQSFTARFKKTKIMPAGVDTGIFTLKAETTRKKNSICMVGRISKIKRIELALEAVKLLIDSGVQVSLSIIGPRPTKDTLYFDQLTEFVSAHHLSSYIKFYDAVPQEKLGEIYNSHEICLNLTENGSFDKTIIESASCGSVPLVSNKSLTNIIPDVCITQNNPDDIAYSIRTILSTPIQLETREKLKKFAESQSLDNLLVELKKEINV